MKSVGIIGTSGRRDDLGKLDLYLFTWMVNKACELIRQLEEESGDSEVRLVSGGAAFADHIAVRLFNAEKVDRLLLCLPARFWREQHLYNPNEQAGFQSNHYHQIFSQKCFGQVNASLLDVHEAIERGAETSIHAGFLTRNRFIAHHSDFLIAFTFGRQEYLKNGGSAHTMGVFLSSPKAEKASLHVNLNDKLVYRPAKVEVPSTVNQTKHAKPCRCSNCRV